MIRLLLVEDEAPVRQGIRVRLEMEEEISIVGKEPDGEAALEAIHRHDRGSDVACLLLTAFDDHEVLQEAIRPDARGYLREGLSMGDFDLLNTLRS